jgi:hypothetical protein
MEKQYLKTGSKVSWLSCGARYYGKVKFTYHQWVYVVTVGCADSKAFIPRDNTQCFNIDDQNLTLEKP